MTEQGPDTYDIYIDESSQTKSRYLVLGGIITLSSEASMLHDLLAKARQPQLPSGELKWGKVSRSKLDAYKRVCDVFFASPRCHYYCVVINREKLDHQRFNSGSADLGFNKEIYQLGRKFSRLYDKRLINLYLDQRTTKNHPDELRGILNRSRASAGDRRGYPFSRCQFRCSKSTPLLAIPDLLNGALAYRLNGRDQASEASPHKRELCDHILAQAEVADVFKDGPRQGKFCIWHRQLK